MGTHAELREGQEEGELGVETGSQLTGSSSPSFMLGDTVVVAALVRVHPESWVRCTKAAAGAASARQRAAAVTFMMTSHECLDRFTWSIGFRPFSFPLSCNYS